MKYLFRNILLSVLFLASCGYASRPSEENAWEAGAIAGEIAEEATMAALFEADQKAEAAEYMQQATIDAIVATDQAHLVQLTEEADAFATEEAEFDATMEVMDATVEAARATYEAEATINAITAEDLTREAGPQRGCPGGCTTYPSWCEPPIKGNVSFNEGVRIYHMHGDESYNATVINPDFDERYFCTPEEAETAGFRRAYR